MAVAARGTSQNYLYRAPSPGSGLVDVLDVILDKGLVIDAYVRVSLVGIELLTIDARIVIASVDTYLKFAQAVNRLDISSQEGGLPDLLEGGMESGAKGKAEGAIEGVKDAVKGNGRKQQDDDEGEQEQDEDSDSDS
jgi:gas vesicle structural protein